jgi:FkbM family methyltransferase
MKYSRGYMCQIHNLVEIYVDTFGYIDNGYFVEVGAWDGVQWSNTSGLLEAGWTGVYFEPQTEVFAKLMDNYHENSNAILINKALSDYVGSTRLYLGGSVSTIHRKTRDNYLKMGAFGQTGLADGETEVVSVSTLDAELDWLKTPVGFEVLVIDVEGSEMDVLRGFSMHKYKPQLVIIEAHEKASDIRLNEKAVCINEYMDDFGYECIQSDTINNIYRRIEHVSNIS